jgi:hypothetical protein
VCWAGVPWRCRCLRERASALCHSISLVPAPDRLAPFLDHDRLEAPLFPFAGNIERLRFRHTLNLLWVREAVVAGNGVARQLIEGAFRASSDDGTLLGGVLKNRVVPMDIVISLSHRVGEPSSVAVGNCQRAYHCAVATQKRGKTIAYIPASASGMCRSRAERGGVKSGR